MRKTIFHFPKFSKILTVNGKKHEVRFLDSLRFLGGGGKSIDSLAKELTSDQLIETKKYFSNIPVEILKGKGFYPYDWMDSVEKLSQKILPSHKSFFSTLTNKKITVEEYEKAREGWRVFGCRNMSDYTKIYCMRDVLLLCDIFENFRNLNI